MLSQNQKFAEKGLGQLVSVSLTTFSVKRVAKIESFRTTGKMSEGCLLSSWQMGSRRNERASEGSDEVSRDIAVDTIQDGKGC